MRHAAATPAVQAGGGPPAASAAVAGAMDVTADGSVPAGAAVPSCEGVAAAATAAPAAAAPVAACTGGGGLGDETPEARRVREQEELKQVLGQLHAEYEAWDMKEAKVFLKPVAITMAPDYYKVITEPMDLQTMQEKIAAGGYTDAWQFMDDTWRIINNCLRYNKPNSFYHRYAQKFERFAEPLLAETIPAKLKHHGYCCGERRKLSGVVHRCRGGVCYVKYGSLFYSAKIEGETIIFCQSHYQKLGDQVKLPKYGNGSGDMLVFPKSDLQKRRHNRPLLDEKVVQCATCPRRVHEVCVLVNPYTDTGAYHCLGCRARLGLPASPFDDPRDLPETVVSKMLEKEALDVPDYGDKLIVRVINVTREKSETKPLLRERFPEHVKEFPYTRRIILTFLFVDGRPVVFFGLVVHEYATDCPEPDFERIYISLLDSVKMPKEVLPSDRRTAIYHSLLRGYLRYAGQRGFRYGHIYTCPPRRGQSYIFPYKPALQREISLTRLRTWYADLLTASAVRGQPAISGFQALAERFGKKPKILEIPYFDGDNWPDIIEDVLKLDEMQSDQAKAELENVRQIREAERRSWEALPGPIPKYQKPPDAGGYYQGFQPPKGFQAPQRYRKRRRTSEFKTKALALEDRLELVMRAHHRDFLIVTLLTNTDGFQPDPDTDVPSASTGEDHSVTSYFKAEKLEFSSLRHAKYSSMCLLHLLFAKDKKLPPLWPDLDDV